MTQREEGVSLGERLAWRVVATLAAAGVYELDHRVFGLDQGLAAVIVIVGFLWWTVY